MKKIVLLISAISLAIGVQGAAIEWKMGTSIKAPNADGTLGTSNAGSGTLSMYVWLVDESVYNTATSDSILNDYANDLTSASAFVKGKSGAAGGTAKIDGLDFSTTEETTYYGIVLTEFVSGDTTLYAANKATAVINTAGRTAQVGNLAKNWGGTGGAAITKWEPAPGPEPTSGILLLLGAGLLALRRKQK